MSYEKRLDRAYKNALKLPLCPDSRYVFISDCHRGTGTSTDNFLRNQNLFFAALQHYYRNGFCYIELGDGDELWENRSQNRIIEIHDNAFWLMSQFYKENRFYMVYGNHDICKKNGKFMERNCSSFFSHRSVVPLFPEMKVYESILLQNGCGGKNIWSVHGHQVDFLNSVLWRLAKFLVRYVWKPLENLGVLDPTSAARNNTKKEKTEERLSQYSNQKGIILIAGHTHRPMCPTNPSDHYFNTGSCVHPRCITALEVVGNEIALVKWTVETRPDASLYVGRKVLEKTTLVRNVLFI